MFEEKLRRFVEQRAPGNFRASRDFHQAALHQILQHAIDRDAAHDFDISARDGLAIGNDGEGFERWRGETLRFRRRKKLADPLRVGWFARQLPAFRFFHQLKGALLLDVFDFELLQRRRDLRFVTFANSLGKSSSSSPAPLIASFSSRAVSGFCALKSKRFDYLTRSSVTFQSQLWIASAIRSAWRSICASSRPSISKRIFGSVPE